MMQFSHPLNQRPVTVKAPRLWTFLFGPLYLAYQRLGAGAISTVVAVVSVGLSWLVYPFFSPGIVRAAYLQKGWREARPSGVT